MTADLRPEHLAELERSGISPELAAAVGLRSICHADAEDFGFRNYGRPAKGLFIPFTDPTTGVTSTRFAILKPDLRVNGSKYLGPVGEVLHLYIPPGTPASYLTDVSVPVLWVEGIKKALAVYAWAVRAGVRVLVVGILGCWGWRRAVKGELQDGTLGQVDSKPIDDLDLITWNEREVILCLDGDVLTKPKVAKAERATVRELEGRRAKVKAIRFQPAADGSRRGADDFIVQEGDDAWAQLLADARPPGPPQIVIGPKIDRVVSEAEDALHVSDFGIYTRARLMVEVSTDRAPKIPGLVRPAGAPAITPIGAARLRELMSASARWVSVRKAKDVDVITPALPPSWAAESLMERPSWIFPPIELVSETPMLRPDGTVIQDPGYDEATGVLYQPALDFPLVPDQPTKADAKAAIELLADPLQDFPFVNPSDGSAAIAAVLTLLGRAAFDGPAPMLGIDKIVQASGGTLLADVIGIVGTGRTPPKMPAPADEGEVRKRILAIALGGLQLVVLDNLTGTLRSAVLAEALTATVWEDRLLGQNKTVSVPLNTIWMFTANNASYASDIARRVVPIRLDPKCEDPEARTGFKYADLRAHVLAERPRLVVAALTILRAYHVAGRPKHKNPPMGSFESWDRLIRGALLWAGQADPLEGRKRIRAESDIELDALREALTAWLDVLGQEPHTAAKVIERSKQHGDLETALAELAGCSTNKLDGRRLGYALRRVAGRLVGKHCFERASGVSAGSNRWQVVST